MSYFINLVKDDSPPHKHKIYEIIVYTKGKGIFYSPEKQIEAFPGKIIIVPPDTVHHSLKKDSDFERIYINGEFNQTFLLTTPTVVFDNPEGEGLMLAKMIYNNRHADSQYIAALVNAFSHFLLQSINIKNDIFLTIKEMVDIISNDFYNSNIDLNSLLKKSGYAEDYIRAQFKRITGKTPTQFLTEVRINHACYLINIYKDSFTLSDVAEKCGYIDYVYFSKKFKSVTGMSPRSYMDNI